MSNVNNETVTGIANSLNGKFENKVANKKDNVSGDFSSDTTSYPTVRAMKAEDALKVNISDIKDNLTSSDSDKPLSAKMGKKLADEKVDKVTGKDLFSGSYADLTNKPTLASLGGEVTVEQQQTAETGFASTYVVKQNGVQVGAKINIMKDKMLRSVSIETVGSTPSTLESNNHLTAGDQYILFVVNTSDNDGTTSLVLPIDDVFDLQTADEVSITLSAGGVFSIKANYVEGIIDDYLTAIINAL